MEGLAKIKSRSVGVKMVIELKDYHQETTVPSLDLLLQLMEKFSYMVAFLKTEVDTHSLIKGRKSL